MGWFSSSLIHYTLHADYEVYENILPMVSFNGFTVYDEANRTPSASLAGAVLGVTVSGLEGIDLVNLECSTNCGTVLTLGDDIRIRATDNVLFGIGYEKSIARDDLLNWRAYFDFVIHF